MAKVTEITLHVPAGRESCADWLKEQSPEAVCHALSLAESALCAISEQKENGDSARLLEEIRELKREHGRALHLECLARDEREQALQHDAQAKESALRAQNAEGMRKLAEELGKHGEQKRCIMQEEMDRLLEERSAQQRRHEDEAVAIRSAFGKENERKEEEHARDLGVLREELRRREGEESIKAAELACRYEDTRRHDARLHTESVNHMTALHERETVLLREMCAKATRREEESLATVREIEHTNKQLLAECTSKMENVLTRSTTAIGQYGERLVMEVFAELNLGELTDDRGVQTEGYADATWTYETRPFKIQALIEVKQVNGVLHSKKDLDKYDRDVRAAVLAGRINCAMFISLSAHVPGRRQFDLDTIQGIPVLRASRSAGDALPPEVLIRLAFGFFANIWPFLCRAHEEGSIEASIEAVAEHLDTQLLEFDKLTKRAASIKDMGKKMEREALELEKIRNRLMTGVEALRLNNPSLIPSLDAPSAEVATTATGGWDSAGGASLLDSFRAWRQDHGGGSRWPSRLDQMQLTAEASAFAATTPNAFILGRDRVKAEIQKTKRRRTSIPETDE